MDEILDICIIGGGINGAGIAADAAGRGLSVLLCEKNDLASGTSSASTKLIHGGLRYLEYYEFKLVRKALREREILMQKAPHLISPLKFLMPYEKQLRPAWLIRLGLFLYDHLAKRNKIPASRAIKLDGSILKDRFNQGFSYYDCFTDDARLVISNALAAQEKGAEILTHTQLVSATRENKLWKIQFKKNQKEFIRYAKVLVNATGPWVHEVNQKISPSAHFEIKLVKGSHIVIPKLYAGDFAFLLQNADGRIVFTIPYQNNFTLIGTTDINIVKPEKHTISTDEIRYLCETVNQHFKKSIAEENIIWSYSGVRCLQNSNEKKLSAITRDYKILFTQPDLSSPALITIIGGKITTFRDLAEDVLTTLVPLFPTMGAPWTLQSKLPGGDLPDGNVEKFLQLLQVKYPWLSSSLLHRYAKSYGTRCELILKNAKSIADLGEHLGGGLYENEIHYLIEHEWASCVEDILWRRTKLGLIDTEIDLQKLNLFFP